jgi:hypothetical protein
MEPQELYGLPLERFTEERNALAKALRKEGRRDEAAEVSKLRKPSVAAWAVNQLVRTQRRDVAALFEAGDSLREAQSRLLAGHSEPDALRDAVEAERAAVDELTHKARGLLSSEGHELTSTTLERVSETLNAAALDEDLRVQVRDGCLVRELHHVGLGGLGAAPPSRSGPRGKASSKKPAARSREGGPRREQTRLTQAGQDRKAEAEARRRAQRTARELKTAQSRRDRAAAQLRQAEDAVRDAEAVLASAHETAADAVRQLEDLRRARERG